MRTWHLLPLATRLLLAVGVLAGSLSIASPAGHGLKMPLLPPPPSPPTAHGTIGGGVLPPSASPCSAGPPWEYAGYDKGSTIPSVGNQASVSVRDISDILASGNGLTAAWLGVTKYVSGSIAGWLQAGFYSVPGGSIVLYVEYNPTGHDADDTFAYTYVGASYGVDYPVVIKHLTTSTWEVDINGQSITTYDGTHALTLSGANDTLFTTEAQNSTSVCQPIQYKFSSTSPWSRSQMTLSADSPYYVTDTSTNGWTSEGPVGYVWPLRPQ
jgi:hypothetical protein